LLATVAIPKNKYNPENAIPNIESDTSASISVNP